MKKNKLSLLISANLLLLQPITTTLAEELNVVVVTAQKEEQNINDVPLSVTAFLAEQIEDMGLTQPSDLSQHVPGLFIKPTVGDQNPVITIRGIGFNDFTSIQNPGAGVYVDQVIVPYHTMMSFQLLDLERVEILKGPQGTLYGRNSTAGAINFVSAKPTQETVAKIRLEYSSWDTTEVEFAFGSG
ncbi:MAG: TonB-dependent receptor plug domain-containing protein, partial [Kangiellaceae bacterium]|nr:TonB-dependent receptor plug domain-containing protein [Kangiellaceae bacterium]